ncbi:cellulose biosynthesis protein BcsQ [Pullulanibacillus pueri]|uniref:AAA domain-containing protein n=1 Tax=Pullulanibacillus pueri TaxID=1437324 RepID=A0A8J3EL55_9BACL|nr:AAA family ATPase [Pullulanibacillus pueri]MBM7681316.1 cellulose biosynthesis protein BcsQ [Pullulanibacillus pueri]GGH77619.1 hypothetical protein GCM10007096_09780 [Pullulanibacillus pueri]
MKKLKLMMADTDADYMESVAVYLRSSHEGVKFDVKLFSTSENVSHYLSNHEQIDILLIAPELLTQELPIQHVGLVLMLEDERIARYDSTFIRIFKYQPLNKLISDILSHYYDENGKIQSFHYEMGRTKVLSMYSASGGVGKTTLAISLARQLALADKKVFYLNLELINSTSLYLTSLDDQPSTQILYHVKTSKDQLVSKIESLKKYSADMKVEYFDLAINPEEMLDLTEEDVNTLVSGLLETKHYDFIIIDGDDSLDPRMQAALNVSDFILWVLNNERQSFFKTEELMKQGKVFFEKEAELGEKLLFILNQFTGTLAEEFKIASLPIKEYTPFIPEWKQLRSGTQLLSTPLFSEDFLHHLGVQTTAQGGVFYGQ